MRHVSPPAEQGITNLGAGFRNCPGETGGACYLLQSESDETGNRSVHSGLARVRAYSARQEGDVVRLEDAKTQTVVSVMPSHGNTAFDMKVKGKNVLQFPFASAAEFKARGG